MVVDARSYDLAAFLTRFASASTEPRASGFERDRCIRRRLPPLFREQRYPVNHQRVSPYLSREGTYRTGFPLYGIPYSARVSAAIVLAARAADFYSSIRGRAAYTEVAAVLRRTLGGLPFFISCSRLRLADAARARAARC